MKTTCSAYASNGISDFCLLCGQSAKQHAIEETPPMALDALDLEIAPHWFVGKEKVELGGLYSRPGRIIRLDGPPETAMVTGLAWPR